MTRYRNEYTKRGKDVASAETDVTSPIVDRKEDRKGATDHSIVNFGSIIRVPYLPYHTNVKHKRLLNVKIKKGG